MEATMIVLCFILLALMGCHEAQPIDSKVDFPQVEKSYEGAHKIAAANQGYAFHDLGDTAYCITWGDQTTYSNRSRPFKVLGNGRLGLEATAPNAILLSQSCGTSCTQYVVLPRRKGAQEHVYLFGRAYDLQKELVAYIPEDETVLIAVAHFQSGKRLNISPKNLCGAAFRGDCIQSCQFKGDSLCLVWWDDADKTQTECYGIQATQQ
jgi:hypothetical protein